MSAQVQVAGPVPFSGSVESRDGTRIGYSKQGQGPPLVFVDGAWCWREFGPAPKLAPLLAADFTVYTYDRRGRGQSGNTQPYAVEKEVEDLRAVADAAGGPAVLVGISSGAVLAMRAAAADVPTTGLVMYEPPLSMLGAPGKQPPERTAEIEQMVAEGRRSDAVAGFMTMVGMPRFMLPMMRMNRKVWRQLESVADTVPHDFAIIGHAGASKPLPADITQAAADVRAPALLMAGGKSPAYMHHAVDTLAKIIPGAQRKTLPKQTHNVKADVLAPAISDFAKKVAA